MDLFFDSFSHLHPCVPFMTAFIFLTELDLTCTCFIIFLPAFFLGIERVEGDKTVVLSKSQGARCTFELLSSFAN